ncbi:thymidylate synthase, partial [Candidatus Pacearchaeota archaeon]|nr:thymidylate synthase [Candidatus Pacearchaeota archaeon]
MHLKTRNVNTAFQTLVSGIYTGSIPTVHRSSRAGDVLQVEEPVIVTYSHPRERVLFNKKRDAPCFFTLFESLWMLAGRNDVAPLAYYNSQIADIASDDGKTFNGAYGYRWRNGYGGQEAGGDGPYPYTEDRRVDQLSIIIDQLRRKPESRRCVLQMWEVESDLLKIDETKDCCCNLSVLFSIRNEPFDCLDPTDPAVFMPASDRVYRYLDMTVYNRSNDMIWGALGANVVHFSFLQEYVANCLGVEVGSYNQVSNNLHVYTERWEPEKWLAE